MSNPFAAIETAINAASVSALANAALTWGAYSASGVLDRRYDDPLGISNNAPAFTTLAASLPGITAGQAVTVASVAYTVREVRPDNTGVTTLILETA